MIRRLSGFALSLLLLSACGLAEDEEDDRNRRRYITFSDPAFERYCLETYDLNGDGRMSRYEAQRVVRIDCADCGIGSLFEIAEFKNLRELDCSRNRIEELDLGSLSLLENVNCSDNRLSSLSVAGLRHLTALDCRNNALEALHLNTPSLAWLDGSSNRFVQLDLRGCSSSLRGTVRQNPELDAVYILPTQQIQTDGTTDLLVGE